MYAPDAVELFFDKSEMYAYYIWSCCSWTVLWQISLHKLCKGIRIII